MPPFESFLSTEILRLIELNRFSKHNESEIRSDSLNSSLNWILQKNHEHFISKGFVVSLNSINIIPNAELDHSYMHTITISKYFKVFCDFPD